MPVCIGERTAIAAAIATHASAAVPPASRTRSPMTAAVGCSQATAPPVPRTVERPPASGLLAMISPVSDTNSGPPWETHDLFYSLAKVTAGIFWLLPAEGGIASRREKKPRG